MRPSAGQRDALGSLLEKFPQTSTADETSEVISDFVDDLLADTALRYDADIKPWLGGQAAFFVSGVPEGRPPDMAGLIQARDVEAARSAVARGLSSGQFDVTGKSYKGMQYELARQGFAAGVVEDFVVIGSEPAFQAVIDASQGMSLAGGKSFATTTADVERDRIALVYVDSASFRPIVDAIAPPDYLKAWLISLPGRSVATVHLRDDAVVLDAAGPLSTMFPVLLSVAGMESPVTVRGAGSDLGDGFQASGWVGPSGLARLADSVFADHHPLQEVIAGHLTHIVLGSMVGTDGDGARVVIGVK